MNNPITNQDGTKCWYNKKGEYHREDGPAFEGFNGTKIWYQNGRLHREDGPAIIYENCEKWWYQNGQLHRTDGPAVIFVDGYIKYYINDIEYNSLEEGLMDLALR